MEKRLSRLNLLAKTREGREADHAAREIQAVVSELVLNTLMGDGDVSPQRVGALAERFGHDFVDSKAVIKAVASTHGIDDDVAFRAILSGSGRVAGLARNAVAPGFMQRVGRRIQGLI